MKFLKCALFAVAVFSAAQANAAITYSSGALPYQIGLGYYQIPTAFSLANPTQFNIDTHGLDHFMRLWPGNSLSVDLGGATSFSFLLDQPDNENQIVIDGQTFTGQQFRGTTGNYITFSSDTPMYNLSFKEPSNACCFEFAVTQNWITAGSVTPPVTAVPEPGTYALLVAGLAVLGWRASRRQGATQAA